MAPFLFGFRMVWTIQNPNMVGIQAPSVLHNKIEVLVCPSFPLALSIVEAKPIYTLLFDVILVCSLDF